MSVFAVTELAELSSFTGWAFRFFEFSATSDTEFDSAFTDDDVLTVVACSCFTGFAAAVKLAFHAPGFTVRFATIDPAVAMDATTEGKGGSAEVLIDRGGQRGGFVGFVDFFFGFRFTKVGREQGVQIFRIQLFVAAVPCLEHVGRLEWNQMVEPIGGHRFQLKKRDPLDE